MTADALLTGLALACLIVAAQPALFAGLNLALLRTPAPDPGPAGSGLVSILIPARNEAERIGPTLAAALGSTGTPVEVLVGDDHSTDGTAALVRAMAARDPRLRLEAVPPLPEGWTGKNNACAYLATRARGAFLLFMDADVQLAPEAAARLAAQARRGGAGLVSAVPRQRMDSLGERLTVPMINLLLVGYLPVLAMRRSLHPSLGAACGQMILATRAAYAETGGHGAIRASLHDGVRLPRLFRRHGLRTDLALGRDLALCRMYAGFREAWAGFSKNAHEGMATPRALPVWTALLLLGHVLPWGLVAAGLLGALPPAALAYALAALALSLGTRAAVTLGTGEPAATIPLHPLIVLTALAIQWNVLLRRERAGAATWKGRSYPVGGAE